ncbi:MAG: DUF2117 domain-containing protein [Methanosarcinales archaeon]|nr:DUF2117 domain-containing protein [Methanosarcinales archaeon]
MTTWRPADKVGVVIHGPEVLDSGEALAFLDWLEGFLPAIAVLGGTMGRVAAIDAALEGRIDISSPRTPSQSVRDLGGCRAVVLLNRAKTLETGLAFASLVARRVSPGVNLLHVDFGGRFVSPLLGQTEWLCRKVEERFSLQHISFVPSRDLVAREGGLVRRGISGVLPGEKISVNGTVVATACSSQVEIVARDGRIIEIRGAEVKDHGLEKLPLVDLGRAIVRSGQIRRTSAPPRSLGGQGRGVVIIDHAAEEAFERARGAGLVITVGDDTTAIAGDVLYRLGIPVIGIVDGDIDGLAGITRAARGSVRIRVLPGHDDLVGREVKDLIDDLANDDPDPDELVSMISKAAGHRLISVERI